MKLVKLDGVCRKKISKTYLHSHSPHEGNFWDREVFFQKRYHPLLQIIFSIQGSNIYTLFGLARFLSKDT